tara:strand:+ start:1056 stop:1325 length:270 start_codon:yes stop_codon:yes gene_type:complete
MLFIFIAHIFLKSWYCGIKLVYLLKGKIFSKGYVLKVSNRITFFLAGLDLFLRLLQSQINKIWQLSKYKQNIEVGNRPELILDGMCVLF